MRISACHPPTTRFSGLTVKLHDIETFPPERFKQVRVIYKNADTLKQRFNAIPGAQLQLDMDNQRAAVTVTFDDKILTASPAPKGHHDRRQGSSTSWEHDPKRSMMPLIRTGLSIAQSRAENPFWAISDAKRL